MNRFLHILSILLVVASCSSDVVVDMPENSLIAFRATVETKGIEMTEENLDHFYATALVARVPQPGEDKDITPVIDTFFENVEFSKAGDCYYSETPYYRPAKRPMTFFLYYPSQTELGVSFNWGFELDWSDQTSDLPTIDWAEGKGVVLKGYSPKPKISEQVDLLYGFANMPDEEHWTSNNGDLKAVFFHTLAQIEVLAKSDNSNYQIQVAGVKIGNVISKGDMISAAKDHWILYHDVATYYEDLDNPIILTEQYQSAMAPNGGTAFLLPQDLPDNAYVAVSIRAYDENNNTWYPSENEYAFVSKNITGKWTASEKYIYKLDFSDWSPSQVTE